PDGGIYAQNVHHGYKKAFVKLMKKAQRLEFLDSLSTSQQNELHSVLGQLHNMQINEDSAHKTLSKFYEEYINYMKIKPVQKNKTKPLQKNPFITYPI